MDIASVTLGIVVISAAAMLEWRNAAHRCCDDATELDHHYFGGRTRSRRMVHLLLGLVGGLASVAGIVGRNTLTFALLWAAVPLVIFIVVILALRDAWQTHLYHGRKLPEIQRSTLPESDDHSSIPDATPEAAK